jgi:hypothetical protein
MSEFEQKRLPEAVFRSARLIIPSGEIIFPFAKIIFPIAKMKYPIAKMVFPFAKTIFSIAKMPFPIAKINFPFAKMVFPFAKMKYPMGILENPLGKMKTPMGKMVSPDRIQVVFEPGQQMQEAERTEKAQSRMNSSWNKTRTDHLMLRIKQETPHFLLGIRVTGAHSPSRSMSELPGSSARNFVPLSLCGKNLLCIQPQISAFSFQRFSFCPNPCRHVGSATETQRHRAWPQMDTDEPQISGFRFQHSGLSLQPFPSTSICQLPTPICQIDFDAAGFTAHTRRMANKFVNNRD